MDTNQIETAEQAEAALAELYRMVEAIGNSPGGRLAGKQSARKLLDGLTAETMNAWQTATSPELAVMLHIIGRVLKCEATIDDLMTFARKAACLTGWKGEPYGLEDGRRFPQSPNRETVGDFLKALGEELYHEASASVRSPGPPAPIEWGYQSDAY